MPTVIDELIVRLGLDTSGFTRGDQQAAEGLRRTAGAAETATRSFRGYFAAIQGQLTGVSRQAELTMKNVDRTTVKSLRGYLSTFEQQFSNINHRMSELGTGSRRTGQAVRAGTDTGARGFSNIATAALSAYAALKTVEGTIRSIGSASSDAAQTTRTAFFSDLPVRWLSAFEQYSQAAGNIPPSVTENALNAFEERRARFRIGKEYSEQFTTLGQLGVNWQADKPELLRQIATALHGRRGSEMQAWLASSDLAPLLNVLALGPGSLSQGISAHQGTALTDEMGESLKKLQTAVNEVLISWKHLQDVIVSANPQWTEALGHVKDWINALSSSKEGLDTISTATTVVSSAIAIMLAAAVTAFIRANAAILNTPLGRFILLGYAASEIAGSLMNPHPESWWDKIKTAAGGVIGGLMGNPAVAIGAAQNLTGSNLGVPSQLPQTPVERPWYQRWLGIGGSRPPAAPAGTGVPTPGPASANDPRGMEPVIRAYARMFGHDPDTVMKVFGGEGLKDFVGDNRTSFGTPQLHIGGGLGDQFAKENPGVSLQDEKNDPLMIYWALKNLSRTGWGPYHAAQRLGIGNREGVGTGSVGAYGVPGAIMNYGMLGGVGDPGTNLVQIATPSGQKFTVNAAAAAAFRGFTADLEKTGYKINSIGGYNPRSKLSGAPSEHAYGLAIDINPNQNPFQSNKTDMPSNIHEMAAKWGLIWGGDWAAPKDKMHLQWGGPGAGGIPMSPAPNLTAGGASLISGLNLIRQQNAGSSTAIDRSISSDVSVNSLNVHVPPGTDAHGMGRTLIDAMRRNSKVYDADLGQE